jgi:hypothetical protein
VFKDPRKEYRPQFSGSSKVSSIDPPEVQHGMSYQQPPAMWNPVPIAPKTDRVPRSPLLPIDAVPKSPMRTPGLVADDDSPYDFSDGDLEMEEDNHHKIEQGAAQGRASRDEDLDMLARRASKNAQDFSLGSFTASIGRQGMLATYAAFPQSSPLHDSMTARIFRHFVNVTGPSISLFERHPANPSLVFQGKSLPKLQQHIWTCKYY